MRLISKLNLLCIIAILTTFVLFLYFRNACVLIHPQYSPHLHRPVQNTIKIPYHTLPRGRISGPADSIPRLFHYIWISRGLNLTSQYNLPLSAIENIQSCIDLHLDWQHSIWTDVEVRAEFPNLIPHLLKIDVPPVISDVIRYHILSKYGGVYIDTDFLCLRGFNGFMENVTCNAFGCNEIDKEVLYVSNGMFGGVPRHPVFTGSARDVEEASLGNATANLRTGPFFFYKMIHKYSTQEDCVHIFERKLFYPCLWLDREDCTNRIPQILKDPMVYAMHRWAMTWESQH